MTHAIDQNFWECASTFKPVALHRDLHASSSTTMVARYMLARSLRNARSPIFAQTLRPRYLATSNTPATASTSSPNPATPRRQESWLTRKVRSSPTALKYFLKVAKALGYASPQQVAARRALFLYRDICAIRADEESAFWQNGECSSV